MNQNCSTMLAEMLTHIERREAVPEHIQTHLAGCADCGTVLAALRELEADLQNADPEPDALVVRSAAVASEKAAVRGNMMRRIFKLVAAVVLVAVAITLLIVGATRPSEYHILAGGLLLGGFIAFVLLVLLIQLRRSLSAPGQKLYKRLRPGRQLSGVALGIAEALDVRVWIPRLVFVVLFFFDGAGLWIYILLDLLMPIHPEDRQHLLRFRIARWWRRTRGEEAVGQG